MNKLLWKLKSRIETFADQNFLFQNLLPKFVSNLPEDVFFIEIGANDGIQFDPIYKSVIEKKWSGVYIEPQEKIYNALVENFKSNPNIFFENIAITDMEKDVYLYSPNDSLVKGNSLIASMSKNMGVLRHYDEDNIKVEKVLGRPFKYIIDKYDLKSKSNTLLLIDVEGFEKEVIFNIDFQDFKPNYLIFEHAHVTYDIHREINGFLQLNGYKIYVEKYDTLAVLK